jgi:hypothetical protein
MTLDELAAATADEERNQYDDDDDLDTALGIIDDHRKLFDTIIDEVEKRKGAWLPKFLVKRIEDTRYDAVSYLVNYGEEGEER